MSMINYASREINCKIVYYGTGLGGKTTNLEYIYSRVNPDTKGKMISLATESERTLFFDFLPIDLGEVRGFKTRFHLYTVPGQVYYKASRRLILKGVDGLVFVADSQASRAEANIEAMHNLYGTSRPTVTSSTRSRSRSSTTSATCRASSPWRSSGPRSIPWACRTSRASPPRARVCSRLCRV